MSKRSRRSDNSKRQQPIQQQRAQARQPGLGGPSKAGGGNPQEQTRQPGSKPGNAKQSGKE